jgi:hypothetical protein
MHARDLGSRISFVSVAKEDMVEALKLIIAALDKMDSPRELAKLFEVQFYMTQVLTGMLNQARKTNTDPEAQLAPFRSMMNRMLTWVETGRCYFGRFSRRANGKTVRYYAPMERFHRGATQATEMTAVSILSQLVALDRENEFRDSA